MANGIIELSDDEKQILVWAVNSYAAARGFGVENRALWQLHDWLSAAPRVALIGMTLETARNI